MSSSVEGMIKDKGRKEGGLFIIFSPPVGFYVRTDTFFVGKSVTETLIVHFHVAHCDL